MNKKLFTLLLALVAIAMTAQAQNTNGHEYVDLGLPSGTLWATCNVGASKPEEYGNHFAWGETSPKEDYTWDTYQWYDNGYTKYNGSDGKTELDLEDDTANANWGGDWQMPSLDQMKELVNQCTWEWETLNGAYGRRITGPNGNSIFLPAAGWRSGTSLNDAGTGGGYWSRMRSTIYSNGAYHMQLGTNEEDWDYYSGRRSDGQVVRAVVMKKQNTTLLLNAENFPDANFRAALAKILGINEGDEITEAKIAATTTLDVSKSRNTPAEEKIADLTGIEHFTALTWLDCGGNQLTSLDVSNNTALTDLYCYNNQLTALDVSGCTSLIRLSFYDNQLTALDVSNNTALIWLSCFSNQLTALDVSNNTALTNLYCYDNQIKGAAMDALVASLPTVSKGSFYVIDTKDENERNICTKAQVAVAKGKGWTVYDINGISSREYEGSDDATAKLLLNAENFPDANFRAALASILGISEGDEITAEKIAATTTLNVSRKQIANLTGIEHFTALKDLECGSNPLTSLDVSKNTALTSLLCGSNQLTSLDVSKNTALTRLNCGYNHLTSLDVSKNTALTWLDCDHNGLTSLDVSKNTALTTLYCEWNYLTSLDVSKNTALERLICYHNRLTSLNVSKNTALQNLRCDENQLTSLDVSGCTALKDLDCYQNGLTSLDVSGCTALTNLSCGNNQLTSLDVSGCTALTKLYCYGNQLTSLDVSKNTALTGLDCDSNQLTSLDVSKNTALTTLYCHSNQIKGKEMDALVASLPTVESGKFYVINTKDENEGNVCTKSQVSVAKGKGWTVYDYFGGGTLVSTSPLVWEYPEYEGSDDAESSCPDNNHPHMIDLGLPSGTKWACCNVGASVPYEHGGYYAWGETEEKEGYYTWDTYSHCDGSEETCHDIGSDIAGTEFDVAHVKWGGSWQIPSGEIMNELISNCTSKWTTLNGTNGVKFTGTSGASIFMPVTGFKWRQLQDAESGYYRTSTLSSEMSWAFIYYFKSDKLTGPVGLRQRDDGEAVRPVVVKSQATGLLLNAENFPDANFRAALAEILGISEGDEITAEKIAATTSIDVSKSWDTPAEEKISDLTGVEHFTALTELWCNYNQLTSLDVSKNTALTRLYCYDNQLTALDVSNNTALTRLDCYFNQLTALDVSKNTALTELRCYTNQLTALDVSQNTALEDLSCGYNQLTSLDVSKNTALRYLECDNNRLTSLDVSNNTALTELRCDGNQLTALDVSKNTALEWLYCYSNQLTALDVSKNTALTNLGCAYNQLTALDVSNNTALTTLGCQYNQLTALDVSKNTALTELYCYYNQLTALDVSKNTALTTLYCNSNQLTSLDVSNNIALTYLDCFRNQIKGEAMDALVASLPTVENGEFYVINTKDTNEGNVCTKSQVAIAKEKGWTVYDYNYDGRNWIGSVEYEGSDDPVEDIDPVDEDDNIDFGTDMNDGDDLNGNVIGDIYYNINTGNGGYNAAEGCIVVKKPTDDGTVNDLEGKDIFGEDFKSQFTGIVFKVPAGKGTIKVNAETTGNMMLKVKIGSNDPVEMELNGKLKVTFPYNVSETTYVYIYAGAANEAKGFGAPASGDAALKIYGIEFIRDNTPTEINAVDSGELTVDSWYTIDGKKLAGEPKEKGIYIRNGRKVVK